MNKYLEKIAWEIIHVKPEFDDKAQRYWNHITSKHQREHQDEYMDILRRKQRNSKILNTIGNGLGGAALGISTGNPVAAIAGTVLGSGFGYYVGKNKSMTNAMDASHEFHLEDNKKYVEHVRKKGWEED